MAFKIIKQILKIVIGLITYLLAVFFFVSQVAMFLDFCPLNFSEALASVRTLSLVDLIAVFFENFIEMIYPVGLLASFSDIPMLLRILTKGMLAQIAYELDNPRYYYFNRDTGKKVGDSAVRDMIGTIVGRLVLIWIVFSLMLWIKPFLLVKDVIQLIRMFFAKPEVNE